MENIRREYYIEWNDDDDGVRRLMLDFMSLSRAALGFGLCWLLILAMWEPLFDQTIVYVFVVPVAAALAAYPSRLRLLHIPYLVLYLFVAWQVAGAAYADSWSSLYKIVLSKFNPFDLARFSWMRFDVDLIAVMVAMVFVLIASIGTRLIDLAFAALKARVSVDKSGSRNPTRSA